MTHLMKLAKDLDLESGYDYFDYCVDSYINGNKTQCIKLFHAMKMEDKKNLLRHILGEINPDAKGDIYSFYFNML